VSESFSARVSIAESDALFRGHFPGRPIFPGVAQIGLVLQAVARFRGGAPALRSVDALRLRRLVQPGDPLDIDVRFTGEGRLRGEIRRGGSAVSQFVLGLNGEAPDPRPLPTLPSSLAGGEEFPPPPLPHQPPMRFSTRRLRYSARGLRCEASVPGDCGFVEHGVAPAYVCIEAAAQCAAAWEVLCRMREGGDADPRIGYLVAVRNVELFAVTVAAECPMHTTIALRDAAKPLSRYDIEVALEDRLIVRGQIDTILTGATAA
jgi:predicted hotdog family 3-hydroxylacyl-ACP dehydratase